MGIAPGVELDDRRAEADRRLDLGRVRLDEQTDPDSGRAKLGDERGQRPEESRGVEPAMNQLNRRDPK
jgi:hypothetical protein